MKDLFAVWRFGFEEKSGEHPVVLISHPDICARSKVVNVLFSSQRQSCQPCGHEVMLNGADGLDWETFCDCSRFYAVKSALRLATRGRVTLESRPGKIREPFLLSATD